MHTSRDVWVAQQEPVELSSHRTVQSFDEMSQSGISQQEESHISDDCAESKSAGHGIEFNSKSTKHVALNTLNSVIEDFDQSPVSDINKKLTDLQGTTQRHCK